MILSELLKHRLNQGLQPNCFFWRDRSGHEIDCVMDNGETLRPVEIKSGKTLTDDFFKGLSYWQRLTGTSGAESFLIYGGDHVQPRNMGQVLSWRNATDVFSA